ncbi:MAG: phosphoribosyltransferase family protein [Patescibacteria group bacterium]
MYFNRKKILDHIAEAIFPRFCLICNQEGELLCRQCAFDWQPREPKLSCPICASNSMLGLSCHGCDRGDFPSALFFSFIYADPVARKLICAWKYDFDLSARDIIFRKIESRLELLKQLVQLSKIDAVVPIPLHLQRLCERGFDQAECLAEFISRQTSVPTVNLLKRSRRTGKQAERTDEERRQHMQLTPFQVIHSVPQRVLLIDDVWTTGATAQAAIKQLKNAGAQEVFVYTLARGG